jgi:membrane-associated phospholipid phosphatase
MKRPFRDFLIVLACLVLPVHLAMAKSPSDYLHDTKDYFTAPLHWEAREWAIAGEFALGIAASHLLDGTVRDQFAPGDPLAATRHRTRDGLPLAALVAGTFAAGILGGNKQLVHTGLDMGEAIVLTSITTKGLKAAFGRQRPRSSPSPNRWGDGGSSFPSGHTSVAFAAAQVLADELPREQWGWRVLAYGLAGATAVARMDSNAHWLSDTVAGAALGMATGRFVSNRGQRAASRVSFSMEPMNRGAMINFAVDTH